MKQKQKYRSLFSKLRYFCWVITLMFLVYFLMIESDGELV
ncbi:putative membrane protein [Streptococcus pneumoniae GA17328]|nr:putative membrane protein [Streptococcus pneumoniae GA17328]